MTGKTSTGAWIRAQRIKIACIEQFLRDSGINPEKATREQRNAKVLEWALEYAQEFSRLYTPESKFEDIYPEIMRNVSARRQRLCFLNFEETEQMADYSGL